MKKSLNNRFKGKRLVTGDEGELTQHEILLKEEENGVVVKERGTDGEVKQISAGGNEGDNTYMIEYYIKGSLAGQEYTSQDTTPFTTLYNLLSSWEVPEKESTELKESIIIEYDKVAQVPVNKNISINYERVSSDAYSVSIDVPDGAEGVGISKYDGEKTAFDYIICNTSNHSLNSPYISRLILSSIPTITNNAKVLYDAVNNIFFYYGSCSTLYLTINEGLEATLRIWSRGPRIEVNSRAWDIMDKGNHKRDNEGFIINPYL